MDILLISIAAVIQTVIAVRCKIIMLLLKGVLVAELEKVQSAK